MFQISEVVTQMYSVKKGVLRNFAKFTGNTYARVSGTGFFCDFCEKSGKLLISLSIIFEVKAYG